MFPREVGASDCFSLGMSAVTVPSRFWRVLPYVSYLRFASPFQIQFPSCDPWPGRVRRAVHLNTLAQFEATMVSSIGEIMAHRGAPMVAFCHVTCSIV